MDHSMPGMVMDLPPFTLARAFAFSFNPFFFVCCVLGLVLYGWGVLRLRLRGDSWSVGRTVAFVVGVVMVGATTCTGFNDYGMVMFSVHMIQHMMISMIAPILVLLGAPVTLTLRALPVAGRGRTGPRELLLAVLHSRYVQVLSHPAVTLPVFISSLYVLYFTPLFDFLMRSETGHIVMMVHFLAVGLLFFWPIIGVDPGPRRSGYLMRILELFAGMPFHAFFGIALMMASEPLIHAYKHPVASLGIDALADQTAAGGIAWGFSEVPSVIVLITLVYQWYKSDQRQARRLDRAADRDGDKELVAYNAYLEQLRARSAR